MPDALHSIPPEAEHYDRGDPGRHRASGAAPNDQRRRRRTGGVPKRPGAGPLTVMGDARPPREHIDAAHDALKTSRTVGTVWARDPNLKIKDQRHAVDLGIHRWGGGGSDPRPRGYKAPARTTAGIMSPML